MGTSLAVFHQQLTALLYNVSDLKPYSFTSDIDVALHEFAKWNIGEPQSILMMREGPVNFGTNPALERGVVVRSTSDAGSRAAALAVVENLSNLGFDAFIGEPIPNEIPNKRGIQLSSARRRINRALVEGKPLPELLPSTRNSE